MKKINYIKFVLDLAMAIIFALLFNKGVLGIAFHEIAGLAIGAVVLVHCGLNWKWIKGVTQKLFKRQLPFKTRLGYILNVLLLVDVIVIIVTGIFISKVVFSSFALRGMPIFRVLHVSASYILLILIGIHLGLHWNWAMTMFKRIFKIPEKKVFSYISKVLAVLALAFGLYSANSVGFVSKLSISSPAGMENRIEGRFKGQTGAQGGVDRSKKPKGGFEGREGMEKGEPGRNASIVNVVSMHLGILSIFTVATYYIEKLLKLRKKISTETKI